MGKKMTWEEMKNKYPDEWLLITDFDLDHSGHIIAGSVRRHSKDKDKVYRLPALNESTAFRYTGKSDFAGVRSHAENRNKIPQHIPENEIAEVILLLRGDPKDSKINSLVDAMNDPLFLDDLNDISEDFKDIDTTGWA